MPDTERKRMLDREAHRRWRESHPEKSREVNRRWDRMHPDNAKKRIGKWRRDHPSEVKASEDARYRIQLAEKCEMCGGKAQHRHHPDYSRPLLVMHLCAKCHRALHNASPYGKEEGRE